MSADILLDSNKPLLFLDWDETLFPTMYVDTMKKACLKIIIDINYIKFLNEFLLFCYDNFNTFIVTNMEYDGIKHYIREYNIEVPCEIIYTRDPPFNLCKQILYDEVIDYFHPSNENLINVITVGDSSIDHYILNPNIIHEQIRIADKYLSIQDCFNCLILLKDKIKLILEKIKTKTIK